MPRTMVLDETIEVGRPLDAAFAYLSDFARIEEWDPAVARAAWRGEGPYDVGSELTVSMKAGFDLHYTVVERRQNQRLVMDVRSTPFTAVEAIDFTEVAGGTRIRYVATFTFTGPFTLLAGAFPGAMDRAGKQAMLGLKRALDDAEPTPTPSKWVAAGDAWLLPGLARFTRQGYAHARKQWGPMSAYLGGRHVVITGATSGLGLATARALARRGSALTLVARDERKASRVAAELARTTGNTAVRFEIADLAIAPEVHALATRLCGAGRPVDVLIHNAGALLNTREVTPQGYERSFASMLLAPTILTERLRPLLAAARGRVISVLSGGMYAERIRVDDLQSERGTYSGEVAYARAKRGLMIMTEVWAERFQADGIVVNAMHPGWADTPGVEASLPRFYRVTQGLLRTPEEGADTIVWLAAATEAGRVTGGFFLDRQLHPAHVLSRTRETPEERAALVEALAELSQP